MQIRWLRYLIEFSSILVLAFLWPILTDVTLAKQFNIDHASSQASTFADDVAQEAAPSLEQSLPSSIMTDQKAAKENPYKDYLKFTPESLDFGYHPISVPVIETVYVENVRPDEANIQLLSISGNTEHFHCSFFEDKIITAGTNTSFQVVFLARQEGLVNNTLYIHSSVGSFVYRVSAVGEASPFRVRPLIGARVPLNASFASLIYIYNPFSTPLQLTEMYTSGGGLHLELPENEYEAPSSLWNVPPYESRPIMKAHFLARIASNYTSYIRIRTNASDVQLMLPVEVEVSNSPGLYTPLDTLDFGVIRSQHDSPRVLPIQVINAAMKYIYVHNIVVTPLSAGLSVENFEGPVKLPPRSSSPYHIADLVLDPQQFSCSGLCVGKVLVKSKNNQYKLAIPFVARMIQGELYFNSTLSHFLISDGSTTEQRTVTVENRFDSPVLVHEIELPDEAKPYFKLTVNHQSMPIVLPVGKPFSLLNLGFTPSPQLSHFSTVFRLLTNYSSFELPLFAYRGRLDLFIPNSSDQTQIDLGLVGLNEQKSATFVVSNHNPIAIKLIYWQCNLPSVSIEFVGTSHGNISAINQQRVSEQTKNLTRSEATLLQPEHFAVFRVHVNKLAEEGPFAGQIAITTPFESLTVPLHFKVLRGSLKASKVILPRTFPGRIVTAMLQVKSNYTSAIKLKGAFVEPKDERFKIKLPSSGGGVDEHQQQPAMMIKPGDDNHVLVQFDASAGCLQRTCYTALDIEKEVGHLWLLGTSLYSDTAYIDRELYRLLRNQWTMLTDSDKSPAVNIRLQVDGFGSFITEAQAQLYWPRISNKLSIRFPSVRIGRSTTKELLVENPADRAILIQALNVVDYPTPDILLAMMSNHFFHQQWSKADLESFEECIRSGVHKNRSAVFTFVNSSNSQSSSASAASSSNSNRINEWLGVAPNANSYTMILPPGARQRLAITFQPKDEKNFTSLLVLRNNLTVIDVVMLRGEGGRGLLKLNQKLPNIADHSQLLFEFTEKQLERKCRGKSASPEKVPSTSVPMNGLIIRQKFQVMNTGRMSMQIRSFLIDGQPCEGHGFHISHCDPQFLTPNQSFDIEMVYSPDFTTPYVSHELTVLVDDDVFPNGQKYELVAKIPQKYLRQCLDMLPRPLWESVIYYMLVTMALFVLFLSIVVAISDAHRITNFYELENQDDMYNQVAEKPEEASASNGNLVNNNSNHSASRKQTENGHANGTSNGKAGQNHHHHQQQQQQSQQPQQPTKFRNRKGNKGSNGNSNNNNNNNSKSSFRPSNLIPAVNQSKLHEPSTSASRDDELNDKSGEWTNSLRKKALIRQDSNSSEHSQRSTDTSSTSSSRNNINSDKSDLVSDLKDRSKKSATDSSTEALQGTSAKLSISNDAKQKGKSAVVDQVDKKANKKNNNSSKAASGKAGKAGDDHKSTISKPLEKTASVDGTSTKSSSESLNFIPSIDSCISNPTKARSATLPLTSKAVGGGAQQPENVSISQSDMSGHHNSNFDTLNGRAGYNVVVTKSQRQQPQPPQQLLQLQQSSSNKQQQQQQQQPTATVPGKPQFDLSGGSNKTTVMSKTFPDSIAYNSQRDPNSIPSQLYFDMAQPNSSSNNNGRDIWDSPITSFDSEMAMNMIVKQTEAFATNDPDTSKFGSASSSLYTRQMLGQAGMAPVGNRKVIAPPPGLPIPAAHQRHDSGSSSNSANMTRFSEDKWEIGEWSNDLANANKAFKSRTMGVMQAQQQQQQPIGDALKFGANSSVANSFFATGDPIRDLQFQQAAAKSRNFTRLGIKDFDGRPGGGISGGFGRAPASNSIIGNNGKNISPSLAVSSSSNFKSAYPVGHSLGSVIGLIPSASAGAIGATSNHSSHASPTLSSSTSSTFSPVIGRPNPPSTAAGNHNNNNNSSISASSSSSMSATSAKASRLFGSTSSNGSQSAFSDAFSTLPSPLDANFSLKTSLLSDIDWSLQPTGGSSSIASGASNSGGCGLPSSSTLTDTKLNSIFNSWNTFSSASTMDDVIKKGADSPNTNIFDFGPPSDSVWSSPSNWATFDKAPQKSSSSKGVDNAGDNSNKANNINSTKWPSPPSSAVFEAARGSVSSNSGGQENRSWSPFDDYRLNPSPSLGLFDATSSATSSSSAVAPGASSDLATSAVFELFSGSSPWSPLGSPYPLNGGGGGASLSAVGSSSTNTANTISKNPSSSSISDTLVQGADRFPPNPSPTLSHKSSSSNNSSSHSSN